jgi:hypothetical protein
VQAYGPAHHGLASEATLHGLRPASQAGGYHLIFLNETPDFV